MNPLTPRECNLQDFQFMPLDVQRLRDSELATALTGEEAFAAVLLWCAAWHQVPAASLPNDDRQLSKLAGYGKAVGEWQRVREGALRGFLLCDDGRLYHPVVAEKAREAWQGKLDYHYRKALDRIRKAAKRHETEPVLPSFEEWLSGGGLSEVLRTIERPKDVRATDTTIPADRPPPVQRTDPESPPENALKGQVKGQGQGEVELLPPCEINHTPADASFEPVVRVQPERPKPTAAGLAAAALVKLGFRVTSLDPNLIDACTEGVTLDQLLEVAKLYPLKPAGYVIAAARRMHAERGTGTSDDEPAPDPLAAWRKERTIELENRLIAIRHSCDVLGAYDATERDKRIADAREQHQQLIDRGPEDLAA